MFMWMFVLMGRLGLGATIGLAIASVYWVIYVASKGHNVGDAIQGRVEDALGTLQGMAALGLLCGVGVGLCSFLIKCSKTLA